MNVKRNFVTRYIAFFRHDHCWTTDKTLNDMCNLSSFQKIHYLWRPFLPDPKDDHVLELAVASQIKRITTFNVKDFKGVDKFGVAIISPKQLLEEIEWVH